MSRPNLQLLRGWVTAVAAGAVASILLSAVQLPSPVLFGSLLGAMAYALTFRTPLVVPAVGFRVGQGLVGVTIGAMVSLPTLQRLGSDWVSILTVTLGTLVISVLAGQILGLHPGTSSVTGAFAMIAGGASGVTALAHELGADDRVVTIVQYLRVVLVLLTMPVVAVVVFHPAAGAGPGLAHPQTGLLPDLAFTVVSVVGGLVVAGLTRLPAGSLLGPLLVAVVLSASRVLGVVAVPSLLVNLGYALIGSQVGLRFTRASLRSIAALLPLALGLIAVVVAACAGMGVLLSLITGVDPLTAYLATTPGGVYAVLATAADSGSDVTYVLAVQVVRVLAMLLAVPLLARVLTRKGDPAD